MKARIVWCVYVVDLVTDGDTNITMPTIYLQGVFSTKTKAEICKNDAEEILQVQKAFIVDYLVE